jgi:hypothetical protein
MIQDILSLYAIVFIVPMVVGYAFRSRDGCLYEFRSGLGSATYSMLLGLSLTIMLLVSVSWLMPISLGAWIVMVSLSVLVLLRFTTIKVLFLNDFYGVVLSDENRRLISILLVVLLMISLPAISGGVLTSIEGTGNHDSLHYISASSWLVDNKFNSTVTLDEAHPWSFMARQTVRLGQEHGIPRIGAEILLSYVSVILRKDPVELYSLLFESFCVYWVLICWLVVEDGFRINNRKAEFYSKVIISFSPVMIFMLSNSNYPTMLGCVFLTLVAHIMISKYSSERVLVSALCLSALASIYPELILPLALIILINIIYSAFSSGRNHAYIIFLNSIKILIVGILSAPWVWFAASETILNVAKLSTVQGNSIPSMFEGLSFVQEVVSFIVLDRYVVTHGGVVVSCVIVIGIVMNFMSALRYCRGGFWISIYLAFLIEVTYVWLAGFNYGKFKVAEYFSTYIAIFFSVGASISIIFILDRLRYYWFICAVKNREE